MSNVHYHFQKTEEGWIVYPEHGGGDILITKSVMRDKLYDAFQHVLDETGVRCVDNCKLKLPTHIQFPEYAVQTPMGEIDVIVELYIRKNTIEAVNLIITGSQGTVARTGTERFMLSLPHIDFDQQEAKAA